MDKSGICFDRRGVRCARREPQTSQFSAPMLYLFSHTTLPWVKFGYTQGEAWRRLPFWTNRHPPELCGQLGAENFSLLRCWVGCLQTEALVKEIFPDRRFEFWPERYAVDIILLLDNMAPSVSVPPRPPLQAETTERLPGCNCGGAFFECRACGKSFSRSIALWNHLQDVHRCVRVKCACGKQVISRNLKRHQLSEGCKRARAA